jgi:hypothetical protein
MLRPHTFRLDDATRPAAPLGYDRRAIAARRQAARWGSPGVVVIFGFGGGSAQDLGEAVPARCPNCHNDVYLHHVRSQKSFSLYFVPIAQYGTNEYLLCPICQKGLQVTPQNRQAVTSMAMATRSLRQGHLSADAYRGEVARFWAALGMPTLVPGAAPSLPGAVPPAAGASGAPGATGAPALAERLADLARLHDDGVLTDAEFEAAKARLIGG